MIEESFVRLYARDFVMLSVRSEQGQYVAALRDRKLVDARSHAQVMDARKGSDHLAALTVRVREEATRFDDRGLQAGTDPAEAAERRHAFLNAVADELAAAHEDEPNAMASSLQLAPIGRRANRA